MSARSFLISIIVILLIGAVIRFVGLDQFPPQLNRDEAALALNARLIAQAGFDEWHHYFPLQFQSFGDYKLPGYIYILVILFQIHVSDVVVRIPAAIAGVGIIIATTFWVQNILNSTFSKSSFIFLMASLSLTPFAIFYSRMAWEANVSLFLMVLALWLLHARKPTFLTDGIASFIFLGAILTYNSAFILFPFVMVTIPLLRGVKKFRSWMYTVTTLIFFFILSASLLITNNSQKSGILLFQDGEVLDAYPRYRAQLPSVLQPMIGNQYVYFAQIATRHYLETFSPYFLITHGGQHPWHSIMGRGHLFWCTYLLFFLGVFSTIWQVIVKAKKHGDVKRVSVAPMTLLYLLAISPLPSIFTTDSPHATRSLFTFLMLLVFSAIGFQTFIAYVTRKVKNMRTIAIVFIFALLLIESSSYLYQYFVLWPGQFSPDFQLGLKQKIVEAHTLYPTGNIGIQDSGEYLYATVAWYDTTDAKTLLNTIEREGPSVAGLYRVTHFSRYYFVPDKTTEFPEKATVLVPQKNTWEWQRSYD